ncbi:unnamed protein product (macronuclear) [Paramecium tetraurelia]|uniref:Uncharacterized protein n=1 Tax=Paramecium tetraurelia TaxID=5888 RepID=A0DNT8_PARTE|nr:uncharacterized protein GSPATT00018901001 [Paramecium tetraurelia]CAK84705.1 unnamed protein product [Paramecium tetraurelia]|eukprot:XP_001452102.1 hypothetical protein (macronuclear) [Paramecium tetraurelia strain d4-2]
MTNSDINNFFDTTISNGNNFMTGYKFSTFPTQFIQGCGMVWNNAIYQKPWSISKPHYVVTFRSNVTYGDGYGGVLITKFKVQNPLPIQIHYQVVIEIIINQNTTQPYIS